MKIIEVLKNKLENRFNEAPQAQVEHYFEQAANLWKTRSFAIKQPHYSIIDINQLDENIDQNLDGLMNSLEDTWELCLEHASIERPADIFVAAVIAFRSRDLEKIKTIVSAGFANEACVKALTSAMGWLPDALALEWINKFLTSKDLEHKYLAIAACSVRRENPGELFNKVLQREECLAYPKLRARAVRLIGELKRHEMQWALDEAYSDNNPEVKFWVNWSTILLGDFSAANQLNSYVITPGPMQEIAVQTAFRVLPVEIARTWISQLASLPEQTRMIIKAVGALGDPHAIPWLIERMRKVDTARLAAESFSLITGIDLERYDLTIATPDEITAIPNDNTPENTMIDEDENLPFPDVDKVAYTWKKHGNKYQVGQRYFMGATISQEKLQEKLSTASPRIRYAAALELALLEPDILFCNIKSKSKS
ncbi:TIGR02270 family protein [Aliikangiella sp. IMCC44359]|uniref:TIGR02270 family protein n=1 Tax=Aliikangiella sp. IMCC44359 TaxID=3459125 RepID=UPI00403A7D44